MSALLLVLALSQPVDVARPALVYGGAALADYASTRHALSVGARESNPLVRSHLAGWKAAQVAALVGVDVLLQKKGHRGKAKALRIGAAVVGAGLALHNVRVAQAQRRVR